MKRVKNRGGLPLKSSGLMWQIWSVIVVIIGLWFFAMAWFLGYWYQNNVEKQYIDDFTEIIAIAEHTVENDASLPDSFFRDWNTSHKHVAISLYTNNKFQTDSLEIINPIASGINKELNNAINKAGETNEKVELMMIDQVDQSFSYMLQVKPLTNRIQKELLISFVDLSFLDEMQSRINTWILILSVFYLLTAFSLYVFLKKQLGVPLSELRDIAFDYAVNDFSKQAPVKYKDELSQLALAMNKMAKSLEITGTATRQEKELLGNIVTSISTGILYYNQDKTLLLSNPKGVDFLEHTETDHSAVELYVPEFLAGKIDYVIQNSSQKHFEYTTGDLYYEVTLIPLFDGDLLTVRGVLVSIQDVSKERRLDKMRVDFINNVSHELRTPLVMIQGYSEAIVDDVAESREEKNEMATIIGEESKRMNRMVNEMLDLSRMEAGYIQLFKENIDLKTFFEQLLSRFNNMATNGNVELSLKIESGITNYFLDKDKMDQVFVNLINNAIRHTIIAERENAKVIIWIHFDEVIDDILIDVRDNGTGIPESDIPYVFDRFYKADKSRGGQGSNSIGTGIGLSLVKSIVEAHDGFVDVKNNLPVGAIFTVHLPYVDKIDAVKLIE